MWNEFFEAMRFGAGVSLGWILVPVVVGLALLALAGIAYVLCLVYEWISNWRRRRG